MKKLGPLMYWNGKGELITRTEYMRWKFRNNKEEKISVDESGMTQFDPLLSWEDHSACWKMQYRGSLGETLLHILIMGNSLIHTKIARTLIRHFPRTVIDVIEVIPIGALLLYSNIVPQCNINYRVACQITKFSYKKKHQLQLLIY